MFFLVIFIAVVAAILTRPTVKGFFGELAVKIHLSRLNKEKYRVLHDVLIPAPNGKTAQIDHIIVSVYGIFVVETKNYKGWIFGDDNSPYWTQVIYKRKEKFYNPIKQNEGHVKALKEVLENFSHVPIYPIVTFSLNADLKINVNADVTYNIWLVRKIKKHDVERITMADVNTICNVILAANSTGKEERKGHVREIRNNLLDKANKIRNNICPRCGSQLVDRNGKFGYFKGCSGYPKCRFILKG